MLRTRTMLARTHVHAMIHDACAVVHCMHDDDACAIYVDREIESDTNTIYIHIEIYNNIIHECMYNVYHVYTYSCTA